MKDANNNRPVVLVVEDTEWIRGEMKRVVEGCGYRVTEAAGDEEAISTAERERPSLILTEEELPTFYALTERLREHSTLHDVPVVIVNPDMEEGARFGDAFVLTDHGQMESFLNYSLNVFKRDS